MCGVSVCIGVYACAIQCALISSFLTTNRMISRFVEDAWAMLRLLRSCRLLQRQQIMHVKTKASLLLTTNVGSNVFTLDTRLASIDISRYLATFSLSNLTQQKK